MNRREFIKQTAVATVAMPSLLQAQSYDRPNIVLFLADDMTWRDCGVYGNAEVQTPNLDQLSREGMRFDGCFTSTSICAPTRQQLYTGMFPIRNGAYPQGGFVRPGVKSMAHHFQALGYRVGIIGKQHYGPSESFPFEVLKTTRTNELLDADASIQAIQAFIDREPGQPYCLVVASRNPHLPYTKGPQDMYDPDKVTIPPYLIDTPETRKRLAAYYAEITALDAELERCMQIVSDNTLVVFSTEQGSAFPYGGKWTCYENGLHTGLIMRWPGKIEAGSSCDALVQYVDILPTLLQVAGGDPTASRYRAEQARQTGVQDLTERVFGISSRKMAITTGITYMVLIQIAVFETGQITRFARCAPTDINTLQISITKVYFNAM